MAPLLFNTFWNSICQFNSSKCSPLMPEHTDKRSETIPSSRITSRSFRFTAPCWCFLLFSSPHSFSTGFSSKDWDGHSRSLVLCSVTHFCVVFEVFVWIIVQLDDPNMAHYKISNRVRHLFIFYLLVLIESMIVMCLKQVLQDLQQEYRPTTSNILP